MLSNQRVHELDAWQPKASWTWCLATKGFVNLMLSNQRVRELDAWQPKGSCTWCLATKGFVNFMLSNQRVRELYAWQPMGSWTLCLHCQPELSNIRLKGHSTYNNVFSRNLSGILSSQLIVYKEEILGCAGDFKVFFFYLNIWLAVVQCTAVWLHYIFSSRLGPISVVIDFASVYKWHSHNAVWFLQYILFYVICFFWAWVAIGRQLWRYLVYYKK